MEPWVLWKSGYDAEEVALVEQEMTGPETDPESFVAWDVTEIERAA